MTASTRALLRSARCFSIFAESTYFGPERERYIAAANALVPGGFTNFADWARVHMKAV
jgi:hypothetical protein